MLRELFLGDMADSNPDTGHFMERFWLAVLRPEEYICWDEMDMSGPIRNEQGQLSKGRWLRTPMQVRYKQKMEMRGCANCGGSSTAGPS